MRQNDAATENSFCVWQTEERMQNWLIGLSKASLLGESPSGQAATAVSCMIKISWQEQTPKCGCSCPVTGKKAFWTGWDCFSSEPQTDHWADKQWQLLLFLAGTAPGQHQSCGPGLTRRFRAANSLNLQFAIYCQLNIYWAGGLRGVAM